MELFSPPTKRRYGPDVFRLWFSPSGRRRLVLAGHSGGANRLWNWDAPNRHALGRRVIVTDSELDNCYPFPAFDRTLRHMALDDFVEDRRTRKRVRLAYGDNERILSPDGRTAFAVRDYFRIDRFDLSWEFEGKSTRPKHDYPRSLVQPGLSYSNQLAVSPAGDLLVVWTSNGKRLFPFRLADDEPLAPVALPVHPGGGCA